MSHPPSEPCPFFIIVSKDKNIVSDLNAALAHRFPNMHTLIAKTPGEALLLLAKAEHVASAFLAMHASEIDVGVLGRRLRQRNIRIVLIGSVGTHEAGPLPILHWPFEEAAVAELF